MRIRNFVDADQSPGSASRPRHSSDNLPVVAEDVRFSHAKEN